jgi:hypothetical protein
MARARGCPEPERTTSRYVAVRDAKGEILWDKMPQTAPWICHTPSHVAYRAPETGTCLHPDCLGPIVTSVQYPASVLLKKLRAGYLATGRTVRDLAHDIAVDLLLLYHKFDVPVTTAHGPIVNVIRRMCENESKDTKFNDMCKVLDDAAMQVTSDSQEARSVSPYYDRPDRLVLRSEFLTCLDNHIPDEAIAYLSGVMSMHDLMRYGYSVRAVKAFRDTAQQVLRENGYEPRFHREEGERRAAEAAAEAEGQSAEEAQGRGEAQAPSQPTGSPQPAAGSVRVPRRRIVSVPRAPRGDVDGHGYGRHGQGEGCGAAAEGCAGQA